MVEHAPAVVHIVDDAVRGSDIVLAGRSARIIRKRAIFAIVADNTELRYVAMDWLGGALS